MGERGHRQRGGEDVVVHRGQRSRRSGRQGAGPQPVDHLRQARPAVRVGVEGRGHDPAHLVREPVERVLPAAYPVHHRHRRAAAERRPAGAGEGHRRGPRVHVGGDRGVVAVQDLRCQVARCAEQPPGVGELRVVGHPGQPEVDEDRAAALHQHVGRLHVAVQHTLLVHAEERLAEPGGEPREVRPGDRALLTDVVVQREPGHVAGGDVGDVAPRVGVHDLGHPGRADPRQGVDLAGEPRAGLVVTHDVRAQHLQRDPWPTGALGEVDHAHAALTDAGEEVVAADGEPGHRPRPPGPGRLAGGLGARDGRHAPRLPGPAPRPGCRAASAPSRAGRRDR